jgi:hypothetical protein
MDEWECGPGLRDCLAQSRNFSAFLRVTGKLKEPFMIDVLHNKSLKEVGK